MKTNSIRTFVQQYTAYHKKQNKFIPGVTPVPVSGKVFDEDELINGIEAVLDGWWTEGRFAIAFEKEFAKYLGVRYVSLVNSGSSANLVALTSLTSKTLGEKRLMPGDEVITVACGFPTTVNPILQNNCTAVLLDNNIATKNVDAKDLEKAITKKTKVIMMAHMLGNVLPVTEIRAICKKYNLWFIEDCCDALGSTYKGKMTGTFGDIATFSFYPAHQMTMGEGGAVVTNSPFLHRAMRQFRDWGRDCWCGTGCDNTCGKRFKWKLGELPFGYDHKYIYSQVGYNLKLTDMQAAIGLAQLKKLPEFIKIRRANYIRLLKELRSLKKYCVFPEVLPGADPSWFGFSIVVKDTAPFTRNELVEYLESRHIATRSLFAGNLTRHPAYLGRNDVVKIGNLKNADILMNNGFWIGVNPTISKIMLDFMIESIVSFIHAKTRT
jgi:CDP-4-dehydro-6-deoxyglucose reductase, E1